MIINPKSDKPYASSNSAALLQPPAVAALKPKRRFKVLEETTVDPISIPARAAAEYTLPARLKRSGQPQQIWKDVPKAPRAVPSKSLSAQQLVEWLARSPFASPALRHSH